MIRAVATVPYGFEKIAAVFSGIRLFLQLLQREKGHATVPADTALRYVCHSLTT